MKTKLLNIYHKDCSDGTGSATAFVELATRTNVEVEFLPLSHKYDSKEVIDFILKGDYYDIYITDFSLREEDLREILPKVRFITIIDHHAGVNLVLEKLVKEFDNFNYVFDNSKSGAVLTWEFLFPYMPEMLLNVQDRDLWQFKLVDTNYITSYLYQSEFLNDPVKMREALNDKKRAMLIGGILYEKRNKDIENVFDKMKNNHLILECGELPPLKIYNSREYVSELGNKLSKFTGEPVGIFIIEGNNILISIRSIDNQTHTANEYALALGGNGHKNASGAHTTFDYFIKHVKNI